VTCEDVLEDTSPAVLDGAARLDALELAWAELLGWPIMDDARSADVPDEPAELETGVNDVGEVPEELRVPEEAPAVDVEA